MVTRDWSNAPKGYQMSDAHRAKVIRLMIASEEAGERKFGEAENQNYDSQVQSQAQQVGEEAAENKDGD